MRMGQEIANIDLNYDTTPSWSDLAPIQYWGELTYRVEHKIREMGTVIDLEIWHPLVDKSTLPEAPQTLEDLSSRSLQRWIDPFDSEFWEQVIPDSKPKGIIGEWQMQTPYPHRWGEDNLDYAETLRLVLEPSAELPPRVYTCFGKPNDTVDVYQRTVFTCLRGGRRYSLENLIPIFSKGGQFLNWHADLRLVFPPAVGRADNWLPWNALYPLNGREMCGYVKTFADSYTEDPYLSTIT